ncbi:hypothetical protein KIPB_006748, partial [Kipferlia bialata]
HDSVLGCSLRDYLGSDDYSCSCMVSYVRTERGYALGPFKEGTEDHRHHCHDCVGRHIHLRSSGVAAVPRRHMVQPLAYLGDGDVLCVGSGNDSAFTVSMPTREGLEERVERECSSASQWQTPYGVTHCVTHLMCGPSLYVFCGPSYKGALVTLECTLDDMSWHHHPSPPLFYRHCRGVAIEDDLVFVSCPSRMKGGIPLSCHRYSPASRVWIQMDLPNDLLLVEYDSWALVEVGGMAYLFVESESETEGGSHRVSVLGFSPQEGKWEYISRHSLPGVRHMPVSTSYDSIVMGQYIAIIRGLPRIRREFASSVPCLVYDTITCNWTEWNVADIVPLYDRRLILDDGISYLFCRQITQEMDGIGIGEVDPQVVYPHPSLKWAE